jgi:nucleoside-diphosphate-sugar epimerase
VSVEIALVGANGRVGTELCFLIRGTEGPSVRPIVRNELGTLFLEYHDFECTVADVSDPGDAERALEGADVVVVAAFAWQYSNEGFEARGSRKANEAIVANSVRHAPEDAVVVYFSSQAAFGAELGGTWSDWSLYTREKRNAERLLFETCEERGTAGYVLRLGNVYGENQENTGRILDAVEGAEVIDVAADPDEPTNVVHAVTVLDAVRRCGGGGVEPGRYSLVNRPEWTPRDVFDYYGGEDLTVRFHPPDEGGGLGSLVGRAWELIEDRQDVLRTFTVFLPDAVNQFLFHQYLKTQRAGELSSLETGNRFEHHMFEVDPMPGERVPGLERTETLLAETEPAGVFR